MNLQVQREKLLTTEDKFAKELKSFTDTARRVSIGGVGLFSFCVKRVIFFSCQMAQLFGDNVKERGKETTMSPESYPSPM